MGSGILHCNRKHRRKSTWEVGELRVGRTELMRLWNIQVETSCLMVGQRCNGHSNEKVSLD